ncbi:MAG TPA: HAMP domain-containing sensor histidine kinase [Acidimicrobiales bacterium]|jgi:two-component system OmpR family sensor kinase|nr:HAMP domain-containing sensor histidine kinase [Acidimicrobiales bacterium]
MSLRTRLLVAISVIALAALAIADVATYSALQSFLYQRVDQQLDGFHQNTEHLLNSGRPLFCGGAGPFAAGRGGAVPPAPEEAGRPSNAFQFGAVEVRSLKGAVVNSQSCPAYLGGKAYTPHLPTTITGFSKAADGAQVAYFTAPATQNGGPSFRVRASTLKDGNLLIVAQPLSDTGSTLHQLLLIELAVTGGAVALALLGGFWLVRVGLRPLRDMERSAESIAAGDLTQRVPGENDSTEVGRLARTLNVMLSRIEAAFSARLSSERRLQASEQRLRRFVADASHELRTPIAAVSAYAELFGRGASEHTEDLGRVMDGIRTETDRMEHLVADLLLLARLDEGRPMEQRSVDLVALCAEAVETAAAVGPAWPLRFEASEPIEIIGDATSLRQVVDNLLGNVRAHTPAGTSARVDVAKEEGGAIITIADTGPGMEPEEAEHIFERFYRSDPSRSRVHGGAGLGLSIVSAIVANHGGRVSAESRPGAGTTFTVHLPTAPPAVDGEPDYHETGRSAPPP